MGGLLYFNVLVLVCTNSTVLYCSIDCRSPTTIIIRVGTAHHAQDKEENVLEIMGMKGGNSRFDFDAEEKVDWTNRT